MRQGGGMARQIGRRAALAGAGALAACAGGISAGEIDAAAAAERARRPEDYVNGEARAFAVGRDGRPAGLLWGTFHTGYDEATVPPRAIRARFAAASSLSVEVVLDRVAAPVRRAMLRVRDGALLRADPAAFGRLDPATRQEVLAAGLPAGSVERHSLLGLAQLVNGQAVAAPAGVLPAGRIVDANLIAFARSLSIPVRGLEEADAGQVERLAYADPNGDGAAAALRLALRRRGGASALMGWARRRYAAGEVAAMLAGVVAWRAEPSDLARWDRRREALLAERNAAWLPRLEAALGEPGSAFAAFGAGHLVGEDGVVALLRGRGWEVSACVGDRCAG